MNTKNPPRVIYPYPKQLNWQDGFLSIEKPVTIDLPAKSKCASFFEESWNNFTCDTINISVNIVPEQSENSFVLRANGAPSLPQLQGKSAYALTVNKKGAAAVAQDETSLRQAWLSLLQMLDPKPGTREIEGVQLPYVEIQDHPLLAFRSAHLCIFPETPLLSIEKSISLLAMHKYTHVVLEFWGMLKFDVLPELAWPQAYSKDEVRPLLQHARDLGVEPIPMFNHWGHATGSRVRNGRHVVLDQNPSLVPLFEPDGWTWCLTNPHVGEILAGVRQELLELFGDVEYFHVGCDESYSHATCDSCRQHDSAQLFADHLNGINDDLKKQNIRPLMWGDALLDRARWKNYTAYGYPDLKTFDAISQLSRDFIIVDWQYNVKDARQNATLKYFQEQGFDVVMAPWHDEQNIHALGKMALEEGAFGMMLTTWHTLPTRMNIIDAAGRLMWHGDGEIDDPRYGRCSATLRATFLRRIRKGPVSFSDAGWRSVETIETLE